VTRPAKILVVDDTPANVKLLADLLTYKGYEVATAATGEEGLKRLAEQRPDLVLLDIMMPGMNGYEVCRAIRADPAHGVLPVVMITSLDPMQERIKGLEAGADDFLTKPVDKDELAARLKVGERIIGLQKEMRQMQGLLSICMLCKKIREGKEWIPVDSYVSGRTATSFSHAFCPECLQRQNES
jgi:adenylate cyclase